MSALDEDVVRDDVIGHGSVDVTDVAFRDAGVPGSQLDVRLFDHDVMVSSPDGLFVCADPRPTVSSPPSSGSATSTMTSPLSGLQRMLFGSTSGGSNASCGVIRVAVKVVVDLYMMNNAATRLQSVFRGRQQRRKFIQVCFVICRTVER